MKTRYTALFAILGLFAFSGLVQAADETTMDEGESESIIMKEVVVTATRYPEEISAVPANVTVITKEDIASSTARDVPSILRTQAGIHVVDITGSRRNYRVDLRGFGETAGSNTLVLVDGRRANQPDLSGTDWTLIPLNRVKRIEIIRGGRGSVLYGDNASGGVINIITKEGEKLEADTELAGGSYDTFSANAYLSGIQRDLSYALSGRYHKSDGYRDNSDMDAKDIGLNLGYMFGDTLRLNLSGGYHEDDTRLPGGVKTSEFEAGVTRKSTVFPDDFAETEDYYIKMKPEAFFLGDSVFQVDASFRKREFLSFASFFGGAFTGETEIKTTTFTPQLIVREPLFGLKNNVTFGFDYVRAEEDIVNTVTGLFPSVAQFDLEKKNYGYYIHEELYPVSTLALSAGFRHDRVKYNFAPSTPEETNFSEDLLTAGISYKFYGDSFVYFSFAESFRYAVLDELFSFFFNTIDTTLTPQTSDDYELGLRFYFTKTLYANINIFRIKTEEEIFYNPTGGPSGFGANENLDGETRRDGVEILLGKSFDKATFRLSYTYTDAQIRDGQFGGSNVPGVPEHQAAFDAVIYPLENFIFALNGTYMGERFFESDFANAFAKQNDYVVVNLKLKYGWKNITGFLDINNLFDEKYSEFGVITSGFTSEEAFFPSPGINFLVGLKLHY